MLKQVLLGQLWQDGAVWVMFRQVKARLLRLVGLSFGALRLVKAVEVWQFRLGKASRG